MVSICCSGSVRNTATGTANAAASPVPSLSLVIQLTPAGLKKEPAFSASELLMLVEALDFLQMYLQVWGCVTAAFPTLQIKRLDKNTFLSATNLQSLTMFCMKTVLTRYHRSKMEKLLMKFQFSISSLCAEANPWIHPPQKAAYFAQVPSILQITMSFVIIGILH